MAYPVLHKRGDIIVMAAWTPATPMAYTNFCGATGITLTVDNAIQETQTGDCDDWGLPVRTVTAFGAQTVTMTINAQLAVSNRDKLLRWALNQLEVPIRVHIVDAPTGEIEYIDGVGILPSESIDGIGNVEGAVITTTLNVRFVNGVTTTNAT